MRLFSRLGVRARLVALMVGLLVVGGSVAGIFLEADLRHLLEERLADELARHARAFDVALAPSPQRPQSQELAQALGEAADVRLTLVGADGRVLADSYFPKVSQLDNHNDRPEVMAARSDGEGRAQRHSATLDAELHYVALLRKTPKNGPAADSGLVVRASRSAEKVDAIASRLRFTLAVGGVLALLVTLLVSMVASHVSTLSLRRTVMRARKLNRKLSDAPDEPDTGDELDYLMGSFESMSGELRKALRSLAKARDRFEVVVEGMDQAIFRLGAKREIKLANRAALEWLRLEEQPLGEKITDHLELPGLAELLASDHDAEEIELPSGRRVMAQHSRMRMSKGSVLVLQDVTKLRRLEAVRRDFVANVSHELRTPISVIRANTEALIERDVSDDKREHFLGAVHRASVRLSRLVADLLDLARIESGSFKPEITSVRLADTIGACADAVMPRIEEREHEVEVDLAEGLHVQADPEALEQVLVNLLDNAAKYTPAGGHLAVRAHRLEGRPLARIEICDDGPGIAPEHRPRLFERFYRVDPGRSKEMGGTGLGLAIVKHLVLSMGGEVGMEPAEGGGTVFYVELPCSEPAARAA